MLSLTTAPIAAQAADSVAVRTATTSEGEELVGISPLILILAAAAAIAVVVIVASDDNDEPASP